MGDEIMYGQDEEEMCDDGNDDDISAPKAPSCDMTFESSKAAQKYYLNYAQWHGFGIRIDYARQTNDGVISRGRLVCTKAGKDNMVKEDTQKPKSVVPERRRNTTVRIDCKSLLRLKRVDGNYKVVEFIDTHNLPIIKKFNLVKYMRSHRDISPEEREFLRILHRANVTTSRMMQIMAGIHKSPHNVTYTRKDVANFRESVRREHNITDIEDTLAYFQELKSEDGDFFFSIQLDEESRVMNLFWMPCAPFIGINNHGMSVQFGCGFLRNEDTMSFAWLFNTFLEAMDGLAPINIITDQDFAMRAGIESAHEKLGAFMGAHEDLHLEMNDCLNNSYNPGEFEHKWTSMIARYGVQDHVDLNALWEKRASWIPAYFMQNFFPFLQSTQHTEGFNAVLKRYVNPSSLLYNF
ncbi:hypothetical protein BRADI_5g14163v3, partial [Brachypodium distachyon]